MAERWGKPVIVENRPGGDGLVGVAAFAGMRDDHTLLFSVSAPFTVQPLIQEKLSYDPVRDAVPISLASDISLAIATTASLKVSTLAELMNAARAQPGKLNWTAGPGLPRYVFAAYLKRAGLDMAYVSYREVPSALQDLGAGQLHVIAHGLSVVLPQAQSGKARLLAVTNSERAAAAPDIPTVAQIGFPQLAMDGFCGFFGWRDMPSELRDRIAADIRAVAADQAMRERLIATGQAVRSSTPAEFAAALEAQRGRIADIVQLIGTLRTQ